MQTDPISCACENPICEASIHAVSHSQTQIEVTFSDGRADYPIYLDASGARAFIRQLSAAIATIDLRDVAALSDIEQLQLRYRLLDVAATQYAESRDQLAQALAWYSGSHVEDVLRDYEAAQRKEQGHA